MIIMNGVSTVQQPRRVTTFMWYPTFLQISISAMKSFVASLLMLSKRRQVKKVWYYFGDSPPSPKVLTATIL